MVIRKYQLLFISLLLMGTGILAGCQSNKANTASSQSSSTHSEVQQSKESASNKSEGTQMNFKEIQAGDYSSLAGDWEEKGAHGAHLVDLPGKNRWTRDSSFYHEPLKVTDSGIDTDPTGLSMNKSKIFWGDDGHPYKFTTKSGVLIAGTVGDETISSAKFYFYPQGTPAHFKFDHGVHDMPSKNRIFIWAKDNDNLWYYVQD